MAVIVEEPTRLALAKPLIARHADVTGGGHGIGSVTGGSLGRLGAGVTVRGRHRAALDRCAATAAEPSAARAGGVAWLCLPSSALVTAQSILVVGGELM